MHRSQNGSDEAILLANLSHKDIFHRFFLFLQNYNITTLYFKRAMSSLQMFLKSNYLWYLIVFVISLVYIKLIITSIFCCLIFNLFDKIVLLIVLWLFKNTNHYQNTIVHEIRGKNTSNNLLITFVSMSYDKKRFSSNCEKRENR